jgi:hypothetical protein
MEQFLALGDPACPGLPLADMALTHPADNGNRHSDVSVNPVFTREPVRIPRDELPADGIDPELAYQVDDHVPSPKILVVPRNTVW